MCGCSSRLLSHQQTIRTLSFTSKRPFKTICLPSWKLCLGPKTHKQEPKHEINKFHVFIKCHFWFYLLFYSLFLLDPLEPRQRHSNRAGRQQAAGQILQMHKLISQAERPDFVFITSVCSQETEGAAQDHDVTEEATPLSTHEADDVQGAAAAASEVW